MERRVELMEMLEARERRASRQRALLEEFSGTLVCFTMNIAGPRKTGPLIRRGFAWGQELLLGSLGMAGLGLLHRQTLDAATGPEGMYVVDGAPEAVKGLTLEIEESCPIGRLFDLDVLGQGGEKLDRPHPRRCLICGGPARICARSRAHSVAELEARTQAMLNDAFLERDCAYAAELAVRSLLYEACTTPKPGLVDRLNSGSHRDMDIFTFQASAAALWPFFARCVRLGRQTGGLAPEQTLSRLRPVGKAAELDMLRATGGVNTHRGAIFSLGLVCGALGRLPREAWREPDRLLEQCAAMARGLTGELGTGTTAGQRLYRQSGITGIRGQAEAGFPAVKNGGLPKLTAGVALGMTLEEAGRAALLAILSQTQDTNLIARSDVKTAQALREAVAALLAREPWPDAACLLELDRQFREKNLSPGGSADLLALSYLLYFLSQEAPAGERFKNY